MRSITADNISSRQIFSREHDLKRHEKTHNFVSLPCEICDKKYTREDNFIRHMQLKHPGATTPLIHTNRVVPNANLTLESTIYDSPVTEQSQVSGLPIRIPGKQPHGRVPSISNSLRSHPYSRTSSYIGTRYMMSSVSIPPVSSTEQIMKQFTPHQQLAAANILNYKTHHPEAAVPASLITAELAEVHDGRGWCLIGNCGLARAQQKRDPLYDPSKDTSRKRLDHLYDHIRDKHFSRRPFSCSMDPAWYAPLS